MRQPATLGRKPPFELGTSTDRSQPSPDSGCVQGDFRSWPGPGFRGCSRKLNLVCRDQASKSRLPGSVRSKEFWADRAWDALIIANMHGVTPSLMVSAASMWLTRKGRHESWRSRGEVGLSGASGVSVRAACVHPVCANARTSIGLRCTLRHDTSCDCLAPRDPRRNRCFGSACFRYEL